MKIVSFGKPTNPNTKRAIQPSTIYQQWEKTAIQYLQDKVKPWAGDYPVEVHFFIFRDSKRAWDIDNVFCGCLDVLQSTNVLENDTMKHVIPVFAGWAIDRQNPRAELLIQPATKTYFREDLCT
jgi:Holliday junction resolvase RusA-like endonuclease